MRQFKHKTLGWIAKEYVRSGKFSIYQHNDDGTEVEISSNVLAGLIGSDREEVVEKDWIDDVLEEMKGIVIYSNKEIIPFNERAHKYREAIEKHAPKQKKITKEQFEKAASDNNWGYRSMYMNRLRNLLYDNDLIEDFEY